MTDVLKFYGHSLSSENHIWSYSITHHRDDIPTHKNPWTLRPDPLLLVIDSSRNNKMRFRYFRQNIRSFNQFHIYATVTEKLVTAFHQIIAKEGKDIDYFEQNIGPVTTVKFHRYI